MKLVISINPRGLKSSEEMPLRQSSATTHPPFTHSLSTSDLSPNYPSTDFLRCPHGLRDADPPRDGRRAGAADLPRGERLDRRPAGRGRLHHQPRRHGGEVRRQARSLRMRCTAWLSRFGAGPATTRMGHDLPPGARLRKYYFHPFSPAESTPSS